MPQGILSPLPNVFALALPIIAAIGVCAAFLALAGQNPLTAGAAMLSGALGSPLRVAETLTKTIPLLMTGLAVALAFRAGFFNIGAEGQFLAGALTAAAIGTKLGWPVPLVLLGGTLGGVLPALLAGVLKTRRGAPEIITTIMLNYIVIRLAEFAVQGPLQETSRQQPQTDVLPAVSQLPAIIPDTTLHIGLFLAFLCAFAIWWLLFRTERGFLLRAAGEGPMAAQAAGVAVEKNVLIAVALSGALAGLGGAMEIAGATKQLGLSPFGYGYTAIAVALLARLNPLGVVPAALLFGMLSAGGGAMERNTGIPAVAVSIIIGVVICAVAALPKLRHRA